MLKSVLNFRNPQYIPLKMASGNATNNLFAKNHHIEVNLNLKSTFTSELSIVSSLLSSLGLITTSILFFFRFITIIQPYISLTIPAIIYNHSSKAIPDNYSKLLVITTTTSINNYSNLTLHRNLILKHFSPVINHPPCMIR